jgi:hypothetical protein
VAAGGPGPQEKILKHEAMKRAPSQFPFVQSPFLNQQASFRVSVTPSKYELFLPLPLHDTFGRLATSEESEKTMQGFLF